MERGRRRRGRLGLAAGATGRDGRVARRRPARPPRPMKSLIVNADDFGASRGINRGVIEAHQKGILTSASMMVDAAGSAEAGRTQRAPSGPRRRPARGDPVAGRRDGGGGRKAARSLHRADRASADPYRCAPQRPRGRACFAGLSERCGASRSSTPRALRCASYREVLRTVGRRDPSGADQRRRLRAHRGDGGRGGLQRALLPPGPSWTTSWCPRTPPSGRPSSRRSAIRASPTC